MRNGYAVIRACGNSPFVLESAAYDTPAEFVERIWQQLADNILSLNPESQLESFSVEFIFED